MNVAIIGCGRMGAKRAANLCGHQLVACCDPSYSSARDLAKTYGAETSNDWKRVVDRSEVDIVIVATPHNMLAPIATAAAEAGKHVLVEKPGSMHLGGLQHVARAAKPTGVTVRVGYNHRFHPAIAKAHQMVQQGDIGSLMYVEGIYGHGGRPGYAKEWRADPSKSGGGELMDQGTHLIDLARWFLGDFVEVQCLIGTYYWQSPVEDNVFLHLQTGTRTIASLHASWTEWENIFQLEICGTEGKLAIEGLGGRYGTERLTWASKVARGQPPTYTWEYPQPDQSWTAEFAAFLQDIKTGNHDSINDSIAVLKIVEQAYKVARS